MCCSRCILGVYWWNDLGQSQLWFSLRPRVVFNQPVRLADLRGLYLQRLSAEGVTLNGLGVLVDSPVTFFSLCYSAWSVLIPVDFKAFQKPGWFISLAFYFYSLHCCVRIDILLAVELTKDVLFNNLINISLAFLLKKANNKYLDHIILIKQDKRVYRGSLFGFLDRVLVKLFPQGEKQNILRFLILSAWLTTWWLCNHYKVLRHHSGFFSVFRWLWSNHWDERSIGSSDLLI